MTPEGTKKASASRVIAQLMAERLARSTAPTEQKRLKEELARLTFSD